MLTHFAVLRTPIIPFGDKEDSLRELLETFSLGSENDHVALYHKGGFREASSVVFYLIQRRIPRFARRGRVLVPPTVLVYFNHRKNLTI